MFKWLEKYFSKEDVNGGEMEKILADVEERLDIFGPGKIIHFSDSATLTAEEIMVIVTAYFMEKGCTVTSPYEQALRFFW